MQLPGPLYIIQLHIYTRNHVDPTLENRKKNVASVIKKKKKKNSYIKNQNLLRQIGIFVSLLKSKL